MNKSKKECKTIFSRTKAADLLCKISGFFTAQTVSEKDGQIYMMIINKIALAIAIIGTLNWGLVGLFSFDLVAWLSGGATSILARIIYVAVALAGIWCISLLFRDDEEIIEHGV